MTRKKDTPTRSEERARAIAATAELVAACRMFPARFDNDPDADWNDTDIALACRQALAKAGVPVEAQDEG